MAVRSSRNEIEDAICNQSLEVPDYSHTFENVKESQCDSVRNIVMLMLHLSKQENLALT